MFSIYILVVYVALVALRPTRRVALALMPWVIFACSYDAMRLYPNYMVNDIDVRQLYDTELRWFGIALSSGETVIPGAWFAQHHHVVADVMAGLFYLCWVPVPLAFALCLYFRGRYSVYLRFSIAFLVVNLIGFCGYYIHPAAPPWYALDYGFTPVLHTPGNMAGLARFDALTGLPVFHAGSHRLCRPGSQPSLAGGALRLYLHRHLVYGCLHLPPLHHRCLAGHRHGACGCGSYRVGACPYSPRSPLDRPLHVVDKALTHPNQKTIFSAVVKMVFWVMMIHSYRVSISCEVLMLPEP